MNIRRRAAIVACCLALVLPRGAQGADDPKVTVLVAASAKDLVEELGGEFTKQTGVKVVVSPGASNALAAQIIEGAPADLFLSASQEWADDLKKKGLTLDVRPLLGNQLVVVVPKGNPAGVKNLDDLTSPRVKRLALAGKKVPAGNYARESLKAAKIYERLVAEKKIVEGQDVRATLAFVEAGEVEAGIVYATDAKISAKVEVALTIDTATHDPIVYPLVLIKRDKENPAAAKFCDFLASDAAAQACEKYGFTRLK